MKLKQLLIALNVLGIAIFLSNCAVKSSSETSPWLIPFEKVDSVNPVLTAGDNSFVCPIWQRNIKWENKDVFNPAAVVRDNKVYLVYRAEDTIGRFNGTSRLGIA